jgi:hypothetical protein
MTRAKFFQSAFIVELILLIIVGGLCYYSWSSPFTYGELDLDNNGVISPTEFEYLMSNGQRKILHAGKQCVEYYALKDGLPIKIVCL